MAGDGTENAPPLVGYILRAFDPDLDRGQPSIWCNQEEYVAEKPEKIEAEKSDVQPMVEEETTTYSFYTGKKTINWGEGYLPYVPKIDPSTGQLKNPYSGPIFEEGIGGADHSPLKEFDEGIKGLTDRRGDVYGHPKDDFDRIIQMQKALDDCDDEFARHIMNMIAVKMSRLVKTPDHSDSWLDIVGYVRTWFMIKERRKSDE